MQNRVRNYSPFAFSVVAVFAVGLGLSSAALAESKKAARAIAIAEEFMRRLHAGDVVAVRKLTEFPFDQMVLVPEQGQGTACWEDLREIAEERFEDVVPCLKQMDPSDTQGTPTVIGKNIRYISTRTAAAVARRKKRHIFVAWPVVKTQCMRYQTIAIVRMDPEHEGVDMVLERAWVVCE